MKELGLPSQRQGGGWILRIADFLENCIETHDCNVFISEVGAVMYAILSKAQKHMPYWELVGKTDCVTL